MTMNIYLGVAVVVLLTAFVFGLYFSVKNCCKTRAIGNRERYFVDEPDSGLTAEASALQRAYIPMPDELAEIGGSYQALAGIESPRVSPKDDPWIRGESYLNY